MADINYLNPTALKPQFDWQPRNALAGIAWNENRDDYQNLLAQQMRMQALGEEQRRMEMEKTRKDIPLQDAQRTNQLSVANAMAPFAGPQAAETAQTDISKQQFTRRTEFGDEALRAKLDEFKAKASEEQWKQFGRESASLEQAMEMVMHVSKSQGPAAAQGVLQQQVARLKQAGVNFPEWGINPANWEALYNTSRKSVKFLQEMEKTDREIAGRESVARIGANATVQAAKERIAAAQAGDPAKKLKTFQHAINYYTSMLSDPEVRADEDKTNAAANGLRVALGNQFDDRAKGIMPIANLSKEQAAKLAENRQAFIIEQMGELGLRPKGSGSPPPATKGGNADGTPPPPPGFKLP